MFINSSFSFVPILTKYYIISTFTLVNCDILLSKSSSNGICKFFIYVKIKYLLPSYAGVTLSRFWFPMATRIWYFEIRAKPINIRSNNDVYRRPQDDTWTTHDGIRTVHDDTRNTKDLWRCGVFKKIYPKATRRPHDDYTTSYWEYDAIDVGHEGVTWPPDVIY